MGFDPHQGQMVSPWTHHHFSVVEILSFFRLNPWVLFQSGFLTICIFFCSFSSSMWFQNQFFSTTWSSELWVQPMPFLCWYISVEGLETNGHFTFLNRCLISDIVLWLASVFFSLFNFCKMFSFVFFCGVDSHLWQLICFYFLALNHCLWILGQCLWKVFQDLCIVELQNYLLFNNWLIFQIHKKNFLIWGQGNTDSISFRSWDLIEKNTFQFSVWYTVVL